MFFDNMQNGLLECWSIGVVGLNRPERETRDATASLCNSVRPRKNRVEADVRRLTVGTDVAGNAVGNSNRFKVESTRVNLSQTKKN
jgi:hypothetical protein